jgi:hypothetical protein
MFQWLICEDKVFFVELKIRENNGILEIEDGVAGVKCDTNRRIYCKNVQKNTVYKYIGFDIPQGLSKEDKKNHLILLHNALTEYNNTKSTEENDKNVN